MIVEVIFKESTTFIFSPLSQRQSTDSWDKIPTANNDVHLLLVNKTKNNIISTIVILTCELFAKEMNDIKKKTVQKMS